MEQIDDVEDVTTENDVEPAESEKPKETPQAKKSRLERQLKKVNKELGIEDEPKAPVESKKKSADKPEFTDFDDGQYAYLTAKKIEDDGKIAIVRQAVIETGKSLRDVLKLKYVQEELREYDEAQAVKAATPSGPGRTGSPAQDKVAFWVNKGGLPPNTPENQDLRIAVVNARLKKDGGNQFTDNPIGNVN